MEKDRIKRRADLIRYVEWVANSHRLRSRISDPELRFRIALDMTLAIDDWIATPIEEMNEEPF